MDRGADAVGMAREGVRALRAAVRDGLGRYAALTGRTGRGDFWVFALFVVLALAIANILDRKTGLGALTGEGVPGPLLALSALGLVVPLLAAAWRRMQDTGLPGWVSLIHWPVLAVASLKGLGLAALTGWGESPIAGLIDFLPRVLTLLTLGFVLVRLGRPSQAGANRWGEEPGP